MGAKAVSSCITSEDIGGLAREGADIGIQYQRDMDRESQKKFSDEIKEATDGGADMVYDLVGEERTPEPALRAIKRHGKFLVIGFTAGIPKMPL